MPNNVVKFTNVSKAFESNFENRIIFSNANLSISASERICLVGPNGSGKSTFLKLLLNQIQVDSGDIKMKFKNNEIVYLPQDYRNALFPWLTVRANLSLLLNSTDSVTDLTLSDEHLLAINKLFDELLIKINIEKYPYQLSGGEQQSILLVIAVLKNPRLLIADEPFSAVDFHKKEILEGFYSKWISDNKITSIIVSHDIEQALLLSDRVLVLTRYEPNFKEDLNILLPFPRNNEMRYSDYFKNLISIVKNKFE